MLENVVLRKIFGPRKEEVTGGWSFIILTLERILSG
jgi:hypothetical protein